MSYVLYGEQESGAGVWLNVTKVNHYRREIQYAGPDYIFTRHVVSLRVLYNPGTQVELMPGKLNTWGQAAGHNRPPLDDNRRDNNNPPWGPLRSQKIAPHGSPLPIDYTKPAVMTCESGKAVLTTPRLRFHWWDGFQTILQSPLPGMQAAEDNGPKPLGFHVVSMSPGSKTWEADWEIEVCLNEAPMFSQRAHPVLSHQYSQKEDLDQDFYRTTTTSGEVILSSAVIRSPDYLIGGEVAADDLRAQIFLPIPNTMARRSIETDISPDGLRLRYKAVDKEVGTGWVVPGITRVEATQQATNEIPPFSIAVRPLGVGFNMDLVKMAARGNQLERNLAQGVGGALPWPFGAALVGAVNDLANIRQNALALTTVATHVVQVRAWAIRGTPRNNIEDFIRSIIQERIRPLIQGYNPMTLKSDIVHDVTGTFVQGTEIYQTGPLFGGPVLPSRDFFLNPVFGQTNNTGDELREDLAWKIPGPPFDGKSRGTLVERLVSSALSRPSDPSPNVPPATPPALPKDVDLTQVIPPIWPRPAQG